MAFLKIEISTNRVLGQYKVMPSYDPVSQRVEGHDPVTFTPSYTSTVWTCANGVITNTGVPI